jgi:hypothetical protein
MSGLVWLLTLALGVAIVWYTDMDWLGWLLIGGTLAAAAVTFIFAFVIAGVAWNQSGKRLPPR